MTVFQRMNDAGDLLRVGTTVRAKTGNRAIGTFIPAVAADGAPNAVVAAIKAGKPYRGVAQVVDTWYITAYNPIKDSSGAVIGALFVGVPQASALANLTAAIADSAVRENGWVTVYSSAKADAGRVIASSLDGAAGRTDLAATDAAGTTYVQEIVTQAAKLTDGATWRATYRLPGASGAPAGDTTTTVGYYAPYSWAIAVGGYDADAAGVVQAVRDGRRSMLVSFLVAAVLLVIAGGLLAAFQSRRISGRLRGLTAALTRLAGRDLTVRVPAGGQDEIGTAGAALNTAVAELRELIVEVTGASEAVSTAGNLGKGFAVVAGEVKELAQETARATGDVTARVSAIEGDTARAVAAINAITATIAQVNEYQTAIAAAVEEQAATTAEMARNISEVASGSQDVAIGISAASDAVESTRSVVAVAHQAAEELNLTAGRLSGLVCRFTV